MQTAPPGSSLSEAPPGYDPPAAPVKRAPHVTSSSPAKRITFFRSGDARFGGVRMAVHGRSFRSFEALLDDLSRKVPLPFGVRAVTTPRGTRSIRRLDQLQDGGRYLCSDQRQAKPVDVEAAGKGPAVWCHSRPLSSRRKPSRPEEAPAHPASRRPRRIVLLKNTDPAVRRSVIVSRHSARTLRTFLGQASLLLDCHIRKLYTLDGHKIESVQGLMQCPSVLVCVGREPFRPLLEESVRKASDEKLPGLRNGCQAAPLSDGQESRRNVNFGLKTKKSIIHPRSDSSNRSTQLSQSSEKSNGLNASPGNSGGAGTHPHTKRILTNEDIEKRVVVNEDGSLSVHMNVRFHLLGAETLQWSTVIRKSAVGSESCFGKEEEPSGVQQGNTASSSEPEVGDTYAAEEEAHQNCCSHCLEYEIWRHPLHSDPPRCRPSHSSGSSAQSCQKESVASVRSVSRSGGEYAECVVEKATCIQRTRQDGDTVLELRSVSRCRSRSEVRSASPGPRRGQNHSGEGDRAGPDSTASIGSHKEQAAAKANGKEDQPTSAGSTSSKVLEALREDQDDDDDDDAEEEDLPHSASQASGRSKPQLPTNDQKFQQTGTPENPGDSATGISKESSYSAHSSHHTPRPPSEETSCSSHSLHHTPRPTNQESSCSSHLTHRPHNEESSCSAPSSHHTPRPTNQESSCSLCSSHPHSSHKAASPDPDSLPNQAEQEEDHEETGKSRASSIRLVHEDTSGQVAEEKAGSAAGRAMSSMSHKSHTSAQSSSSRCSGPTAPDRAVTPKPERVAGDCREGRDLNGRRPDCTMSSSTNASAKSKPSNTSQGNVSASAASPGQTVERGASGMSNCKSPSARSNASTKPSAELDNTERASSERSAKSSSCAVSRKSNRSESPNAQGQAKTSTPEAPILPEACETECSSQPAGTPASAISGTASGSEKEVASVKSTSTKNSRKSKSNRLLHVHKDRASPALSKASGKRTPSEHSRPASETSWVAGDDEKLPCDVDTDAPGEEVLSVRSRSSRRSVEGEGTMPRPISQASALSTLSKSTMKHHCITATDKRPKSSQSNTSSHLQVRGQDAKPESIHGSVQSVKTESSKKVPMNDLKVNETSGPNSASSQDCLSICSPKQRTHSHTGPVMGLGNSGDSILSDSLSAADPLRMTCNSGPAVGRPASTASERLHHGAPDLPDCAAHTNDHKSENICKARAQRGSSSSQQKNGDEMSELRPSSLPDTSSIEVVNEWLKKIPSDNSIYELGDNFEECCEGREAVERQKDCLVNGVTGGDQESEEGREQQEKAETPEKAKENCAQEVAEPGNPDSIDKMTHSPESKDLIRGGFSKGYHSSVQVMKVLLSSKLDRCNSLPEVSPVYGRKISSSAKGLLDCLMQLQLLGSDPADMKVKSQKYQEVIDILQSLWLSDPPDCSHTRLKLQLKDQCPDDECNPRSSSGVDVGCSSGESGKSLGTVEQALKVGLGRITPVLEHEAPPGPIEFSDGKENSLDNASDPATPDIARRVQGTPGGRETDSDREQQGQVAGLRGDKSPKGVRETPPSSHHSSGNNSDIEKAPEEKDPKDTSTGAVTSVQRVPVTAKTTQDPDPVWVMNLLQKLERQFMTHYVTAVAEFKVRWDLDESVLLDTMINELKDEVHRRIQSSISLELKKMQCRAGRGPRPPPQAAARRSSRQTEQRRRRLKVMHNKSVRSSLSKSEENFPPAVATTDYSSLRSDDDYCPCDACMMKKAAARPVQPAFVNPPPQMKDFDLRKILQKK